MAATRHWIPATAPLTWRWLHYHTKRTDLYQSMKRVFSLLSSSSLFWHRLLIASRQTKQLRIQRSNLGQQMNILLIIFDLTHTLQLCRDFLCLLSRYWELPLCAFMKLNVLVEQLQSIWLRLRLFSWHAGMDPRRSWWWRWQPYTSAVQCTSVQIKQRIRFHFSLSNNKKQKSFKYDICIKVQLCLLS